MQSANWLWDGDPDDLMTEAAEDAVVRGSLRLDTDEWDDLPCSPETKAQHIHAALDRLGMGLDSIRHHGAQSD